MTSVERIFKFGDFVLPFFFFFTVFPNTDQEKQDPQSTTLCTLLTESSVTWISNN